eukprot:6035288-Amphidinium_carterae.1
MCAVFLEVLDCRDEDSVRPPYIRASLYVDGTRCGRPKRMKSSFGVGFVNSRHCQLQVAFQQSCMGRVGVPKHHTALFEARRSDLCTPTYP